MKTRLTSLLLLTPVLIAAAGSWATVAAVKVPSLGWQDGN